MILDETGEKAVKIEETFDSAVLTSVLAEVQEHMAKQGGTATAA